MLALSEAAVDRVNEHLKQLGFSGVRDPSLAGQVGPQQQSLPSSEHLALQSDLVSMEKGTMKNKTTTELLSLCIGDLVTYKTQVGSEITLEDIQGIADFLLEKGWIK